VVVYPKDHDESSLPKLAIRPYPSQYNWEVTTQSGRKLTVRAIRAEDEPALVKFHAELSDRTVFMRFLSPLEFSDRAAHARLARICHCDYDREMTLIALGEDPESGKEVVLGASRMSKLHGENSARFSMLISDRAQGSGVGSALFPRVIAVAKAEKIARLEAITTADNVPMHKLLGRHGFKMLNMPDGMVKAELLV